MGEKETIHIRSSLLYNLYRHLGRKVHNFCASQPTYGVLAWPVSPHLLAAFQEQKLDGGLEAEVGGDGYQLCDLGIPLKQSTGNESMAPLPLQLAIQGWMKPSVPFTVSHRLCCLPSHGCP